MVAPQPGTDVVPPDRVETGIAEQNFEVGSGGGIALENGGDVFTHGFKERDHYSGAKALKIYILLRGPESPVFHEEQIPRGLKPARHDKTRRLTGTTKVVPSRNSHSRTFVPSRPMSNVRIYSRHYT